MGVSRALTLKEPKARLYFRAAPLGKTSGGQEGLDLNAKMSIFAFGLEVLKKVPI